MCKCKHIQISHWGANYAQIKPEYKPKLHWPSTVQRTVLKRKWKVGVVRLDETKGIIKELLPV